MKQKSRIVLKLFRWNILIFTTLLLLQLIFQSVLFEPFLTTIQQRRLSSYMDTMMASFEKDDVNQILQLVQKSDDRGIVLAAVDRDQNLQAGKNFDQYQCCFTLRDGTQKRYTIIEDYLESAPLQAIEVGDEVSIEGYLIDETNALVIPSKVYRTRDGAVLGTDTFLLVNKQSDMNSIEEEGDTATEEGVRFSDKASAQQADDGEASGITLQSGSSAIAESSEHDTSADPAGSTVESEAETVDDKNALSKGLVLTFPFEINKRSGAFQSDDILAGFYGQGSTVFSTRILIVNGDGRSSGSYPITLTGTVEEKESMSNNDLSILHGLVSEEIDHLANVDTSFNESNNAYTVTKQLTTGKYLLRMSHMSEKGITLLGAISLYSIKDINGMLNNFHLLLYSIGLILFAGSIYLFSRKIARPLIEMNGVALKIAQQDFSSTVQISTNDEFATLGNSINEISMNLKQKIDQINEMNERLQRDYEHQLELYQRHKQLSATYSHEIKTPLTILRGYIDGMQNGIYPLNQEGAYLIALRELDSASSIITQMLEITKMESSYFALNKSVVDLWMIFYREYDALKQTMDQKGMNVAFYATAEAYTMADALTLGTVISNALTNAMKYSPRGSRISVRIKTASGQHIFSIENENAFISEKELEKIWQPFYRAEKTKTSHESGSGLGLVIVREILEAHDFPHGIQNTERGVMFYFLCSAIQTPIE